MNLLMLPQDEQALAEFTKYIIEEAGLPNNEMTELTIYQVIYNMPNGKAFVEVDEIANQVRKSIANDVVGRKLSAYHLKRKEEARLAAEAAKQADTSIEVPASGSLSIQNKEV